MEDPRGNQRPAPDPLLTELADYAMAPGSFSAEALATARLSLMDALGCAVQALNFPACARMLGPLVPGAELANGARVPGTAYRLDPVTAAFNFGTMVRWLDYNDTWLAAEWGHPSDNLGGLLMTADWLNRAEGADLRVKDLLASMIQAYEIQGVLALENSFNRAGLDHVLLVKVATTAVAARLLGCGREGVINALSNAWIDGQALRTYRHAPNTGRRKSWAAGDATSRGVWLALMARRGEMGYPSALSAPTWGFQDASFRGQPVALARPLGSYVMENILFKVAFPAEFHAQTAVEAAIRLHPQLVGRMEEVERLEIQTQESAMRIIDKRGPLYNPADRDHCIQYMTAVGLIFGDLRAEDYEDERAADPRIDALREKMVCVENKAYSRDYLDPEMRSIANSVQAFFRDGSQTERVEVAYPLGHRRRREEALPSLDRKFLVNLSTRFSSDQIQSILDLFHNQEQLAKLRVDNFVDLFIPPLKARIGIK